MSEERVHHPWSPSSLQCREGCAKFTQREGPVHEMALVGTRQHNAVDQELDDPKLADYRIAAVADCIRFCEERAEHYPGGTILKEVYLPIDDRWVPNRDCSEWFRGTTAGYLDWSIISADQKKAEIIDWKFGNNAVEEASNNLQAFGYVLGLFRQFPSLEWVKVSFVMPHIDLISTHTFTRNDFETMRLRVCTVVDRAIEAAQRPEDFSLATPNSSSCLFCGLVGKCPKVAEIALKLGKKYRPLEIPQQVNPSLVSDPSDVSLGIQLAAVVAVWAEAFRRQATAKAVEDLDFVPEGYTLVESQKRIVKQARQLGEIAKTFLPPEQHKFVDDLYDVPIGKLEELISTFAPRGHKESTVEEFGQVSLDKGALELGTPFQFLRQSRKQDSGKVAAK